MNRCRFSLSVLGLIATSLVLDLMIQPVTANTADLQTQGDLFLDYQLVNNIIDLEKFCKDYPFNTRCHQLSEPVSQPEIVEQTIVNPETPQQNHGWAVTPEVSTLGLGASVIKSVTSNLNGRVGLNTGAIDVGNYQRRENAVTYEAKLNLLNVSTVLDYHPFNNSGFRMTGGIVFHNTEVTGNAKIKNNQVFVYNNNSYTTADIESVKGKVSLPNQVAPYIGIGWGNPFKQGQRWGFSANLGVMFAGSPQVNLTPNINNVALRNQILQDLAIETKELEKDLKGYSIYPVISLGVSYQF